MGCTYGAIAIRRNGCYPTSAHLSLQALLRSVLKAGKLRRLRAAELPTTLPLQLLPPTETCSAKGCCLSQQEDEGFKSDLPGPYFLTCLCSKELACFSYQRTVVYLDTEAKLASLFAKTKNVKLKYIAFVFALQRVQKAKNVITAIPIFLRDNYHQEEHQQCAS